MKRTLTLSAFALFSLQSSLSFAQDTPQPAPEAGPPPAPEAVPAPAVAPPPAIESAPTAIAVPPPLPPAVSNAPLESGPQPVQGKWGTTFYGFAEFDAIHDSTQAGLTSINDSQGNGALARPGTVQANNGKRCSAPATRASASSSRRPWKMASKPAPCSRWTSWVTSPRRPRAKQR